MIYYFGPVIVSWQKCCQKLLRKGPIAFDSVIRLHLKTKGEFCEITAFLFLGDLGAECEIGVQSLFHSNSGTRESTYWYSIPVVQVGTVKHHCFTFLLTFLRRYLNIFS